MPVQNYLEGVPAIGQDLPEVANMLQRKRVADDEMQRRNALLKMDQEQFQFDRQDRELAAQKDAQKDAEMERHRQALAALRAFGGNPQYRAKMAADARAAHPDFANMTDDEIVDRARIELELALGIEPEQAAPEYARVGPFDVLQQGGKVVNSRAQPIFAPQRQPATALAAPRRGVLTPEEVVGLGFTPGTVVQDDSKGGLKVLQQASKQDIGDGKFAAGVDSMIAQKQTVIDNIARARDLLKPWSTGIRGQALKRVGGTAALDLASTLDSIKADIGFSRLQEMREASPTGGALGQVAVQELVALQSSIASLEQAQSTKQFEVSLGIVEQRYKDLLSKLEKARAAGQQGGPRVDLAQPATAPEAPVPGVTKSKGYIYVGGDPAKRESWVKERQP